MSIQAAVEAVLPTLRAEAEARMTSRAIIHREGVATTDPDGFEVEGWGVIENNIPCRLSGSTAGASGTRTVTTGGVEVQVAVRVLNLPASTTTLQDNDLVELTEGEQAGRFLRIVEATGADQQTALRVPVYEVPRPASL